MEDRQNEDFKVKIQRFGSYLSGMIMPNIGAFIAWGIITALFIPTGWMPNEALASLVDPMIKFLLPLLLIGYTGGKMVYDHRGGAPVVRLQRSALSSARTFRCLRRDDHGPLGGYLMKLTDRLFKDKVRSGFEMLINNFTARILGFILAVLGFLAIGPVVLGLNKTLAAGVEVIVNANLLPLESIFVEPAKVFFRKMRSTTVF